MLHNGLFLKLLDRNISVDFLRLHSNWYSKLTASVMCLKAAYYYYYYYYCVGVHFVLLYAVRQGGVLSRLLFSVYVHDLMRLLKQSGYGT